MTEEQKTHIDPDEKLNSEHEQTSEEYRKIFEGNLEEPELHTSSDQDESSFHTIEALKSELQNAKDQWVRAEAENQNIRTRHKKELEDTRLYAVQKFARDVVEAAENLRRGIDALPKQSESEDPMITKMREGFESTERSFLQILEKNGIKSEDPTGTPFDANKHQAMAEQPSEDHPPGTVLQSWTPTWTLNNRLLKPAMVIVTKSGDLK